MSTATAVNTTVRPPGPGRSFIVLPERAARESFQIFNHSRFPVMLLLGVGCSGEPGAVKLTTIVPPRWHWGDGNENWRYKGVISGYCPELEDDGRLVCVETLA